MLLILDLEVLKSLNQSEKNKIPRSLFLYNYLDIIFYIYLDI